MTSNFYDNFWREVLEDDPIIINGYVYTDAGCTGTHGSDRINGYGGHYHRIRMNDGRLILTNNLCFRGEMPKNMGLSDNARFVPSDEEVEY